MPKMGMDDGRGQEKQQEIIETNSEPLSERSSRRSICFNPLDCNVATSTADDKAYVEVPLDLRDDSVAVQSVKPAGWMFVRGSSSLGSSLIRTVSNSIKQASLSRWPAGNRRINRNKSASADAFKGLKFISNANGAEGWPAVEKRFNDFAVEGFLPRSRFGQCIGMKNSTEFDIELFDALARRRNITRDLITKAELKDFWDQISDQSFDSRLQTFFDMVDKNADGKIDEEEVRKIISLSASDNKLTNIQERAAEYARLIMEELDPNNDGYIEIYNLEMLLRQLPSESVPASEIHSRYRSKLLSEKLRRWYQKARYFLEDQWKRVWVVALWLCICAGLFIWKFMQYRYHVAYHVMGYCVCVAKGGAETLKFNMALILFPVCRNTITWLRNKTKLGAVVPFDDNLNLHMVIASGIVVGVGLHAISHLTCDFPRLLHASEQAFIPMQPFFGNTRPNDFWWFVKGTDGWTGIVMVVLMAIAFTLALPCFRRHKPKTTNQRPKLFDSIIGFNSFWYAHHLFVVVYVLLIIHSIFIYLSNEWYEKTTWMYLAIPMILYACERLTRTFRSSIRPVNVLKVNLCPGDVLALQVTKPPGFKYQSGQYMFVRCAAVSSFEWHPFSITSAPQDDYLSVHIRAVGDWTHRIKTIFTEACNANIGFGPLRTVNDYSGYNPDPNYLPRVKIDGPYGAPAQDYQKYEVVLLVGLGIGATPFISIVKDILNNLRQLEEEEMLERDLERGSGGDGSHSVSPSDHRRGGRASFKTRRAYFYWMTREQGSFEWFRGMMNEVAERDKKGAIEMHNHCTSMFEEGNARCALIAILQSLNHRKNGVDVVAGTRVKTHFGRPDWRSVYERIALNHPSKRIGVFYCGMPTPVKELRQLAREFSRNTKINTKFDFHKENF